MDRLTKLAKIFLVAGITITLICCVIHVLYGKKEEKNNKAEFTAVQQICELATLKCYYHDVAEYEKQGGLFQYGYKKFWIEYDGIIEIGIDASKVQIHEPDENGIVQIFVPEAKILNVNADADSIKNTISDTGIFTNITTAEESDAFSEAQATMKKNAENDTSTLMQAHNNAKELLKQYVLNVGKQMGHSFSVEWIDASDSDN